MKGCAILLFFAAACNAINITWENFVPLITDSQNKIREGFSLISSDLLHGAHVSNILGLESQLSVLLGAGDAGNNQMMVFVGSNVSEAEFRSNVQINIDDVCSADIFVPSGFLTPSIVFRTCNFDAFAGFRFLFPLFWNYSSSPPSVIEQNQAFFSQWVAKNGKQFNFSKTAQAATGGKLVSCFPAVVR
jgi:hypothetical protein